MFFSTNSIQRSDRRDAWSEIINGHCGPFVTRFDSEFEGSIDARRVGGFDCARITQTSLETYRTSHEIDRGDPECYFLLLQLSGRSSLEQEGRTAIMNPGDLTIIDSTLPTRFLLDRKNIHLSLHLPKKVLASHDVNWRDRVATPMSRASAMLIGTLLRSSFEHVVPGDTVQDRAIADALIGLIVAGSGKLSTDSDIDSTMDDAALLLRSIQDYVVGHLDSETLSPGLIARAHRISERQLHRLFQTSGLSVCRWIRQSRLDRCAADLRDTAQRGRTITEIAFRWGFNDSARFSRLFRAEFGQAPSQYRALAIGRGAAAVN